MNWFRKKRYEEWLEKQKKKERILEDETVKKILQDKEFVSNLPKEKQKELKTLEIVSIFFMVTFFFIMNYCYKHNCLLYAIIPEFLICLICLILWKIKPKCIKYSSVFFMPIISFGFALLALFGFFLSDLKF